ncbi:SMI1/KNR4 family protein [Couchioplanes caeruleus]|uniref:Knr4/Smi1-like domain-containing protein n=2 Tax=Couchioplanes caeruleus TaxID=56438 RepID=A0A1K0G5X0_9ACTN|nr:SMI1/KNR4 family protein [Couchioplanes caeruleus]OJF12666.1 hypothetical protein BG844_19380 [Couchioplanes caeruleus subsp. caeruleus]ROP27451.1 hypothetical protein EDD30_0122 [Couchioplanes caeruleus]
MLAVSWRDVVLAVLPSATLAGGASAQAVAAAGERLGAALPEDLAELLRDTGGVRGRDGVAVVWPVERIVRDNLELRADAPSGALLFFGGGDTELVGCVPTDPSCGIVAWQRRTGERRTVATDLADYVTRALAGQNRG